MEEKWFERVYTMSGDSYLTLWYVPLALWGTVIVGGIVVLALFFGTDKED